MTTGPSVSHGATAGPSTGGGYLTLGTLSKVPTLGTHKSASKSQYVRYRGDTVRWCLLRHATIRPICPVLLGFFSLLVFLVGLVWFGFGLRSAWVVVSLLGGWDR